MEIKEANFTEEMIQKAKACGSVEELIALARESGRELTEEEATGYFEKIHPAAGELSDDELDNVAGGCGGDHYIYSTDGITCSACGNVLDRRRVGGAVFYFYCSKCHKYSQYPID